MSPAFDRFDAGDVRALVTEYPLAWVCARDGEADHASLLPMIGEYDADGALTHLVGHLARQNPLFPALVADPSALFLFRGPEAYVSPADAGLRDWAPTWVYAQLRVEGDIAFEPDITGDALDMLVTTMESGRAEPWQITELGNRYGKMLGAIIGFRVRVTRLRGRFKLGQDERPETLRTILASLSDPALARWIRRFNPGRE
jgi:transcriptional regulator